MNWVCACFIGDLFAWILFVFGSCFIFAAFDCWVGFVWVVAVFYLLWWLSV